MTRAEEFRQLAAVLKLAAEKARGLAVSSIGNGSSREAALATQIVGIAMEFEIIAEEANDIEEDVGTSAT